MTAQAAIHAQAPAKPFTSTGNGLLQRACACGQHTAGSSGECEECEKKRDETLKRAAVNSSTVNDVLRSPGQPRDPRFNQDFSHVRAHTDMRGRRSADDGDDLSLSDIDRRVQLPTMCGRDGMMQRRVGEYDQRFEHGIEDPLHQPMIDVFRQQQGQPPGGVDEQGNQIAPTDAEIKYRPQPIAVLNGPFHAPINTATAAGMEIQITVGMSNSDELRFVQDSEVVGTSFNHSGSYATLPPFNSDNSTFMSAANIPNDRHQSSRAMIVDRADNHGGSGSYVRHQLDIYNHARYAIFNPIAIPNSGYRITRSIIAGPGTRLVFRVDKTPEACTVRGFSTTAGPSPAQHDEVVIRP
jgi:hypothetical protein